VLEDRALKIIFGYGKDEMEVSWRTLHVEQLVI
jgi:hypothetical protein